MKIAYCDDLHLEFDRITLENTEQADVLVLAGDICLVSQLGPYPDDAFELLYGKNGRIAVLREYNWPIVAKEWDKLFQEMLK